MPAKGQAALWQKQCLGFLAVGDNGVNAARRAAPKVKKLLPGK